VLQSGESSRDNGQRFRGDGHGLYGQTFRATNDARAACAQAISTGATQPNVLSILNSYG